MCPVMNTTGFVGSGAILVQRRSPVEVSELYEVRKHENQVSHPCAKEEG